MGDTRQHRALAVAVAPTHSPPCRRQKHRTVFRISLTPYPAYRVEEDMKKIKQIYNAVNICPNGVVGEKISVSIKLSEYFAEMDICGLSDDERKDIRIAQLECLNKVVEVFNKPYEFSKSK